MTYVRYLLAAILVGVSLSSIAPVSVRAQPSSADPFHIFMVVWRGETEVEAGFRAYLRERGIRARYTVRNLASDRGKIPEIVSEIFRTKPDLVHTWGTTTALGFFGHKDSEQRANFVEDIPGVFSLVAYPVESGVVSSLEKTGRPLTGTAFLPPIKTQLEAIRSYRPITRLGVIYNALENNSVVNIEDLRNVASKSNIELIALPVPLGEDKKPDASKLPELVDELAAKKVGFLYLGADSFVSAHGETISERALAKNIPTFSNTENGFRNSQAMLGFVSRYYLIGKLAGLQAKKILIDGEKPENLPVLSPRYALLIRISVAHKLSLYPPIEILRVAQIVDPLVK